MGICITLCVILALLCLLLGLKLYGAERGLTGCVSQLRAREAAQSTARLRLETPNAAAEELLEEINHLLELRQEEAASYRAREGALRQQISNVSHDLRTPLTSILGYLQLLEGDSLGAAERAEYIGVIKSRAKALQSLITSFYDLSRLDGDEYTLKRESVDLSRLLASLLAEGYNEFTQRGVSVQVELQEGLPSVLADEGAALRIFTNLVRNVLEHGTDEMMVTLCWDGAQVVSTIRNRAERIAPEDMPHVFDRFYTADKMRTGRNTGLGLAIVKGLAVRMGCTVEATFSDGCFQVKIYWRTA